MSISFSCRCFSQIFLKTFQWNIWVGAPPFLTNISCIGTSRRGWYFDASVQGLWCLGCNSWAPYRHVWVTSLMSQRKLHELHCHVWSLEVAIPEVLFFGCKPRQRRQYLSLGCVQFFILDEESNCEWCLLAMLESLLPHLASFCRLIWFCCMSMSCWVDLVADAWAGQFRRILCPSCCCCCCCWQPFSWKRVLKVHHWPWILKADRMLDMGFDLIHGDSAQGLKVGCCIAFRTSAFWRYCTLFLCTTDCDRK